MEEEERYEKDKKRMKQNWSLNRKCGNPGELFIQQKQTRLQIQISPLLTPGPPRSWVIRTPLDHGLYAF